MLIEKARLKRILNLALPIIGGMVSQNVLNLVDTAMVGQLGDAALAAVGIGSFATFMSQAVILGISSPVQATSSRRKGEGKHNETAYPLNTGLVLVALSGPVLSALLYFFSEDIFRLLNQDQDVLRQGIPYYQIRLSAIMFIGMNFAFRGFWNAIDLSRLYLSTLVIMHVSNIVFNYAFIFGKLGAPELGTSGAALGTTLATVLGTLVYFILGFKYARKAGFLKSWPGLQQMTDLIKLSVPSGIQQLFFAAGFTAMFAIISKVGTAEVAAANVLINVMLVAILPALGLGLAAATLVGQALGKKEPADAKRWGWQVVFTGIAILTILGLPMWALPDHILAIFIQKQSTIDLARLPMILVGAFIPLEAIGLVLMNALLGAGDARKVMYVSVGTQWLIFLPAAYFVGVELALGLLGIWILQSLYRLLQTGIFVLIWQRGSWQNIRV